MRGRIWKVYADSSVFGGVFDPEFEVFSARFLENCELGSFQLYISSVVADELAGAPANVQAMLARARAYAQETTSVLEARSLQQAYLQNKIVGPSSAIDALHVALATVSGCDLICSWNFKHIVNFQRIPLYNAVNVLRGYSSIEITSPYSLMEVDNDDA